MNKKVFTFILTALLLCSLYTPVFADGTTRTNEQTVEVCTTGNYGQTNCTKTTTKEEVVKRGEKYIVKHETVNTGVPSTVFFALTAAAVAGVAVYTFERRAK